MNNILPVLLGLTFAMSLVHSSCKSDRSTASNKSEKTSPAQISLTDITVAEAKKLFDQKADVVFLDVRTPAEVEKGTISGARVIDYRADGFREKVTQLDKSQSYIVYCKSGGRSSKASKIMEDLGFKEVQNMIGGYTAWSEVN